MRLRTLISTLALATAVAAPAGAQDRERHRSNDNHQQQQQQEQQPERARARQQPQAEQPRQQQNEHRRQQDQARRQEVQPQQVQPQQVQPQRPQAQRQPEIAVQRRNENTGRTYSNDRVYQNRAYDNRGYNTRAYNGRRWDNGHYESYVSGHHRYNAYVIHPQVVRVIPYHPYVYRPSFSVGIYYGADGYYPYGYTPDYYFNPIPGRAYGGVRITGAPRDAQVFADGYYVGIVDDFDGIFQHINLEAGPHHVEVAWGGYQPVAFDVYVRPGETTTFRADGYFRG
jgi:PEGA domain